MNVHEVADVLTPTGLVSEVQEFRVAVSNPAFSAEEIKRAFGLIVDHAAHLSPHAPGFERAGVALKEAVCMWLDSQRAHPH